MRDTLMNRLTTLLFGLGDTLIAGFQSYALAGHASHLDLAEDRGNLIPEPSNSGGLFGARTARESLDRVS